MGGVLIISSVLISILLWARLDQPYILILTFSLVWFGGLGFLDDYRKITKQQSLGLKGWHKIFLQAVGGGRHRLLSLPMGTRSQRWFD